MLMKAVLVCLLLICGAMGSAAPMWKVFCGAPLYRGRIDPIVNPGTYSGHSHLVNGGNHFSAATAGQSPLSVFDDMVTSTCTTCSIDTIDLSAYWHPDLYYNWPNGTFSVVPYTGLTVYYLSRQPDHINDSIPNAEIWTPIPAGLRMLAGNPYRRNYSGSLEDQAVSYACLSSTSSGPETHDFPTNNRTCDDGLRAQVFFPMCWNGVDLDSTDHKSHMAYPSGYNTGDCPSTHPVRIPGVFFEAMYSVSGLVHGQGTNPFVWANGDPTGYGFHGDFLSGWDSKIMAQAISDPTCDLTNDDVGNNVAKCNAFSKYVQGGQARGLCNMASNIPLTEDLGITNAINALPGCNSLSYGPGVATPCSKAPNASTSLGVQSRFLLKSLFNNLFVSANNNASIPMAADTATNFTYFDIWSAQNVVGGSALQNEGSLQYASASGNNNGIMANRGSPSTWETYVIVSQSSPGLSNVVAFQSLRNNLYVTTNSDGTLSAIAANVTSTELFQLITPNGGYVTQTPHFAASSPNPSYVITATPTGSAANTGTPAPLSSTGSASGSQASTSQASGSQASTSHLPSSGNAPSTGSKAFLVSVQLVLVILALAL